jgi:hypothetical protein
MILKWNGGVPAVLDEQAARDLTDRIRASQPVAYALMVDAYRGEAWKALGYPTWAAYCKTEFERAPLPQVRRREVALLMRAANVPYHAIAAALGSRTMTIHDAVNSPPGDAPPPPEPEPAPAPVAYVPPSNQGGTPLTRQRKAIRAFVGFDNARDFFDADLMRQLPPQELAAFLNRLTASRRATESLINEIRQIQKEGKEL